MSSPAPAVDPFIELRQWITENAGLGDPVRDEAYRCALSALVHRWIKWGFDEALNTLSARDCLNCCLLCGTEFAEMFLRLSFTRAIIEDDRVVLQRLMLTPYIPQSRFWLAKLGECLKGDEKALRECALWIEGMPAEEKLLASILLCRAAPMLADPAWLEQADAVPPAVGAALCKELLKQERFEAVVKKWVRERPAVRYSCDPEAWGL